MYIFLYFMMLSIMARLIIFRNTSIGLGVTCVGSLVHKTVFKKIIKFFDVILQFPTRGLHNPKYIIILTGIKLKIIYLYSFSCINSSIPDDSGITRLVIKFNSLRLVINVVFRFKPVVASFLLQI